VIAGQGRREKAAGDKRLPHSKCFALPLFDGCVGVTLWAFEGP